MREIKFRALINNKMFYQNKYDAYGDNLTSIDIVKKTITITGFYNYEDVYRINNKEITLMQFTGLKDSNRKEIYEGDIVELQDSLSKFASEVKFEYGRYILGNKYFYEELGNIEQRFLKIVGNKYENPELLEVME